MALVPGFIKEWQRIRKELAMYRGHVFKSGGKRLRRGQACPFYVNLLWRDLIHSYLTAGSVRPAFIHHEDEPLT